MTRYSEERIEQLARRAYDEGRADFDVVAERSALLVIDLQHEFVTPGATPYWVPAATRMLPAVATFIDRCRAMGMPVIHTAFARTHEFLDRPATSRLTPKLYAGEPLDPSWFTEGRIDPQVAPLPGEVVIHKPSYGAFYDTPLETILRNLRRDTIVLCGTLTNFCVGTTARQGYERSFRVAVVSDLCASDDAAMHDAELRVLRKGFARVGTADELESELSESLTTTSEII